MTQRERPADGRGRGIAALIEGFFGAAWLGWAQAEPHPRLAVALTVGAVACLLLAVGGAVVAVRSPAGSTPMADPAVRRRYGLIVGVEFGLILVGNALLGALGGADYIAAWTGLVVGVHFVPLGRIFGDRILLPTMGVLMAAIAVVAAVDALVRDTDSSTVAGTGAGALLFATGVCTLLLKPAARPSPR